MQARAPDSPQAPAVARSVQRFRIDPVSGRGYTRCTHMALQSQRFRGSARIQSASRNSPPMAQGEKSEGVKLLQESLIDVGYPMPRSTGFGRTSPDGIFGPETKAVVMLFQAQHGLKVDGVAGARTFGVLDHFVAAQEREAGRPDDPRKWAITTARPASA